MKTEMRRMVMVGIFGLAASGLAAAQPDTWFEQWHKAKYGRPTPAVEAQVRTERQSMAFREEFPGTAAMPADNWFEQWHKAKFGRPTPAQEARARAERENTAFREEPAEIPAGNWFREWHRAKFGRLPGK